LILVARQAIQHRTNAATAVQVDDYVDFNPRNSGAGSETACIYTKKPKYTEPTGDNQSQQQSSVVQRNS